MTLKIARRAHVPPFVVMDVLREANDRAAAGESVLHLEIGQPGTPAPGAVLDAARAALEADSIGYTEACGLPALRSAIAGHYRQTYGVEVDAARVVVTNGSSAGFLLAFLTAFEAGDRVALAAPGYPAYRNILAALGIEPVLLPTTAAERFQPTVERLQRLSPPIDGLIVASPSNPTGTMLSRSQLAHLADHCAAHGIRLVSDEIYHGICYDQTSVSALEVAAEAIVVNSFSKYFSMTGWRLGWLVLPEDMLRPLECLAQNLFISAPTLSQHAAVAAFDCRDELDAYVAGYARNRALLLDVLPKAGLDRLAPADGAFYIYADVSRFTNDSPDFCRRMLAETGVAATPGTDFDPERGGSFVRFSFAGPHVEIAEAADRLAGWLPRLQP